MPILAVLFFVMYAFCLPSNSEGQGNLFAYPLYTKGAQMNLFVIGTWVGLYGIMAIANKVLNSKFDESFYNAVAGGGLFAGCNLALYTYISHDPFVVIASKYIIKPLPFKIAVGWALVLTFMIT